MTRGNVSACLEHAWFLISCEAPFAERAHRTRFSTMLRRGFRTFLFFTGPSKVAPLNGPRHIASAVSCVDGEIRMGIKDGRARYPHATELQVSWLEPNENPPGKRESACDNGA